MKLSLKKKLKKYKFHLTSEKIAVLLKKKICFIYYFIFIKNNYFTNLFFLAFYSKHLDSFSNLLLITNNNKLSLSYDLLLFSIFIKKLFKINFESLKKK